MTKILVDRPSPGVCRLKLDRPEARNALSPDMIVSLTAAVEGALLADEVRALILTGSGGHFCAGGDVSTMDGITGAEGRARMKRNHRLVRMLADADKPIVAAVEGYAVGAGAGIAMTADTIVMGAGASLAFPFLKLGLVPDYGLMYTLPRRIGAGKARQLLLYAGKISASDALSSGVCDHVVPDTQVQEEAVALARDLAAMAPVAMRMAKRLLANVPASLETVLELEALSQSMAFTGDELPEGLSAFREKRPPEF